MFFVPGSSCGCGSSNVRSKDALWLSQPSSQEACRSVQLISQQQRKKDRLDKGHDVWPTTYRAIPRQKVYPQSPLAQGRVRSCIRNIYKTNDTSLALEIDCKTTLIGSSDPVPWGYKITGSRVIGS